MKNEKKGDLSFLMIFCFITFFGKEALTQTQITLKFGSEVDSNPLRIEEGSNEDIASRLLLSYEDSSDISPNVLLQTSGMLGNRITASTNEGNYSSSQGSMLFLWQTRETLTLVPSLRFRSFNNEDHSRTYQRGSAGIFFRYLPHQKFSMQFQPAWNLFFYRKNPDLNHEGPSMSTSFRWAISPITALAFQGSFARRTLQQLQLRQDPEDENASFETINYAADTVFSARFSAVFTWSKISLELSALHNQNQSNSLYRTYTRNAFSSRLTLSIAPKWILYSHIMIQQTHFENPTFNQNIFLNDENRNAGTFSIEYLFSEELAAEFRYNLYLQAIDGETLHRFERHLLYVGLVAFF